VQLCRDSSETWECGCHVTILETPDTHELVEFTVLVCETCMGISFWDNELREARLTRQLTLPLPSRDGRPEALTSGHPTSSYDRSHPTSGVEDAYLSQDGG